MLVYLDYDNTVQSHKFENKTESECKTYTPIHGIKEIYTITEETIMLGLDLSNNRIMKIHQINGKFGQLLLNNNLLTEFPKLNATISYLGLNNNLFSNIDTNNIRLDLLSTDSHIMLINFKNIKHISQNRSIKDKNYAIIHESNLWNVNHGAILTTFDDLLYTITVVEGKKMTNCNRPIIHIDTEAMSMMKKSGYNEPMYIVLTDDSDLDHCFDITDGAPKLNHAIKSVKYIDPRIKNVTIVINEGVKEGEKYETDVITILRNHK